jgi:ribosome-binding protein aMBF1 (putative translation factor)
MGKKKLALTDEIRHAIDASGMSRYRICKTLSIAESVLSRFMSGEAGLSLGTLDRLAELLDMHLASVREIRTQKKKGADAFGKFGHLKKKRKG